MNNSAACRVVCTEKINLREWVHLSVTKIDHNVSFYINGKFINEGYISHKNINYSSIGNDERYIGKVFGIKKNIF